MKYLISFLKTALYWLYPLAHLGLSVVDWFALGWAVRLQKKADSLATIVLPFLLLSISYDNFILGTGWLIGEGNILEQLSMLRFLFHYLVVPFFIVVGIEIAYEAGAKWANKFIRILSWIVAIALAGTDIYLNYVGLELEPTYFLGVLRYTAVNLTAPPLVTIAVNVFMLAIAIGVWIRMKWSWLFVGTLIAFLGNAFPSSIAGTLPGSCAETIMALSLLLTEQRIQTQDAKADSGTIKPEVFDWEFIIPKDGYTIYQAGSHIDGDFIQVYVPQNPQKTPDGKLKLITYLHGFSLCLPKFYEKHLAYLSAEKGYYIFFPDFQKSNYPDDPQLANASIDQVKSETSKVSKWLKLCFKAITEKDINPTNVFQEIREVQETQFQRQQLRSIIRKLFKPSTLKYVRVSISLVAVILVIRSIFFFINQRFGKNLIQLISTVGLSLLHSPKEWGDQAIDITVIAWQRLTKDQPELTKAKFDFYVFGHSLGGLLALSWPYFLQLNLADPLNESIKKNLEKFQPKQILVADPAPSTELGIPSFVILILKIFNVPFAEDPVAITETGVALKNIPVGIMHGASDDIVKPEAWVKPTVFSNKTNYDYVGSTAKQIYFSQSNAAKHLVAFHNQAVTDTTYFEDALFENFGGVKKHPNAYNYDYVWRGLDLVVQEDKPANLLLDFFQNNEFIVTNTFLTTQPFLKRLGVAIAAVSLVIMIYRLFSTQMLSFFH